jgi:hypothetical protein
MSIIYLHANSHFNIKWLINYSRHIKPLKYGYVNRNYILLKMSSTIQLFKDSQNRIYRLHFQGRKVGGKQSWFHVCILFGFFDPEDGHDMFIRNARWFSTDYTALYPSWLYTLHNHRRETLKSYEIFHGFPQFLRAISGSYCKPSLIRICEGKGSPKRPEHLRTQVNGKCNDTSSADENE